MLESNFFVLMLESDFFVFMLESDFFVLMLESDLKWKFEFTGPNQILEFIFI
jgi:hypothetical protein